MREIYKRIKLTVDEKEREFRLGKLDAFHGAALLQMVRKYMPPSADGAGMKIVDAVEGVFMALPVEELRKLMVMCLSRTDVLLDAGWQPLMQEGEGSWPEIEYETAGTLKITLESVLWSLDSFFTGIGSTSRATQE